MDRIDRWVRKDFERYLGCGRGCALLFVDRNTDSIILLSYRLNSVYIDIYMNVRIAFWGESFRLGCEIDR